MLSLHYRVYGRIIITSLDVVITGDGMHQYLRPVSHTHLFVQVPATPTSSNASVDSVLMQHWLAMDIITALMGVMRVTAHVS